MAIYIPSEPKFGGLPLFRNLAVAAIAAILAVLPAHAEWDPLLEPAELGSVIAAEEPVILDIRSPGAYAAGHVEGAVNVPYNAWRGPDSNPGALIGEAKLTLLLSEAGVEPEVPVVVTYEGEGTLDFGSAARVYWTLKSAGVERIAILNGGVRAWARAGEVLETAEAANFPSDLSFAFAKNWMIGEAGVQAVLDGERDALLVDARPEAFFAGAEKHEAADWAGTLAGAVNIVHETFFGGPRLDVPEVRLTELRALTAGREVVSFCNTGHWAATNWFVLSELAGIESVKLYPESMVGWTHAKSRFAAVQ